MARYPGTVFHVNDQSQVTATVPVTDANVNDTVQYLTSFASVKGPEGITLVSGNDFYARYGTQDNIDFKKYGQPLLQASMNINAGAALLAKRAVLDDATLGNATLAVALTKYKDATIAVASETDEDDNVTTYPDLIGSITFPETTTSKYSVAPIVFSIDNRNDYSFANATVEEFKERYDLYKNYITDIVSNENTPNSKFLNGLLATGESSGILSGFTQSIYYDDNNNIIDVTAEDITSVRKVSSITTGIFGSEQKTISSNFSVDDITSESFLEALSISATDEIDADAKLYMAVKNDEDGSITWVEADDVEVTYLEVYKSVPSIDRVFDLNAVTDIPAFLDAKITAKHPEWAEEGADVSNEYAVLIPGVVTDKYTSVARLLNDIMVSKSGYVECEYIFPMFSIFDIGRGLSTKSIGIEYDAATSVSLKKAVYSLVVNNYSSGTRIEKFSFSLNPYARNNSTGYSLDIESAVNHVSDQISVKTYYESYEMLLETLCAILQTNDTAIIENNDILFGHDLSGKYPTFNSYQASAVLKRSTYVYDYAHLDVFGNSIITVNAYCDSDNMTVLDDNTKVKYYYYNYVRQQNKIVERLEMGSDGYCLARVEATGANMKVVPFIVLDDSDTNDYLVKSEPMTSIIATTGQKSGTLITDAVTGNISNGFKASENGVYVSVAMAKAVKYENGTPDNGEYWITSNNNTLHKANVIEYTDTVPTGFTGYMYAEAADERNIEAVKVWIPYVIDILYQEQYRRFFNGDFDRDIFNLDIYFPNAVFDANYRDDVKLAIQRLAAYRGDFMCYMDMGVQKVNSYKDCYEKIPSITGGLELTDSAYKYIRDMHIAVTCLSYKIRNPYDNKVIAVTATYGLSLLYITHFRNDVSKVFAGISNNVVINDLIEGTVGYIPKIYPSSDMTSIANIAGTYPSEDETIINEKQLMCDLKVNYGCYYDGKFSIETEYTLNPSESDFSYWNNVALVCVMMQSIRKACPTARYQFITSEDLDVYQTAIETAMKPWKNRFANLVFRYVQDDNALENKTYYAAIEVVFRPFAQAEIFELTALNYSSLNGNATV